MEMRLLGRTGVSVSKFCFGAGMFGCFGNASQADADRMVHRAMDAGINYFDTSDVYSHGESESMLGKSLQGRRDDVVLATKFSLPMGDDPNRRGNSRRWIVREVEHSLQRLGTDYIDLYQVHRPDAGTDIDETLGALSDLMHQGKVRMIGTSTFPAEQLVDGQVASVIIGPRTPEQLEGLLEGAEVVLSNATLDAIDQIVAPGEYVSRDDDGYLAPELADAALRRRDHARGVHEAARQTLDNIQAYREQREK